MAILAIILLWAIPLVILVLLFERIMEWLYD